MNLQVVIENTPNPNSLKFVLDKKVKNEGSCTFNRDTTTELSLIKNIFNLNQSIIEIYLFDNYITVTQDGTIDWDELQDKIKQIIENDIENHNPDFECAKEVKQESNPELEKINNIIDQTIRPALQMHGGDLQVLSVTGNKVIISYQGACGSCPSAAMGTLYAITNILQEQYNPDVEVELA